MSDGQEFTGWKLWSVSPDLCVSVTFHALKRWRERHPSGLRHRTIRTIAETVAEALAEGRSAKRKPSWATFVVRSKHDDIGGERRWVWTADEEFALVLVRPRITEYEDPDRAAHHRHRWLVVTVVPRQGRTVEEEERVRLNRLHDQDRKRRMKSGAWDVGGSRARGRRMGGQA